MDIVGMEPVREIFISIFRDEHHSLGNFAGFIYYADTKYTGELCSTYRDNILNCGQVDKYPV